MGSRIDCGDLAVPLFVFPWEGSCHPAAEQAERDTVAWGAQYGLYPDEKYRQRVVRTRYGYLAARCYPRADRALLQVTADYCLWFFLADDLFVDRVDTVTPDTIAQLTAMIDVLDLDRVGERPIYGAAAWLDICRRLRMLLSPEHFQRFATGMRLWASTAGLQILNHVQPHPIRIGAYETIRRHTSGMNPCLALSDAANAGAVSAAEYYAPATQRLQLHANNVVSWSNDIQSLVVEARQPGQFRNMVTLYTADGTDLSRAVDTVADRVRAEIDHFAVLAERVRRSARTELCGYITGLQDWMRGYQDWYLLDTQRYGRAATEADDRAVAPGQRHERDRADH
ncbi:sesquiterpene cyclase [Nocardia panacis]|uniref:Terpene synthase n=1 Tax=Nocardia panacis TaxID=2340916 RepID=A0A3A4K0S2_9NOCA|nr:sesquiterpene cyclase [Nocardia panacis]RJO70883.1 sesquiterpene cyclase [Nocardia panacis]